MRIAVNTRLLIKDKLDGIGWFTYESMRRITNQHPEHQFYFIFDRPYSDEFIFSENIIPVIAHPPTRHPALYYMFFEFGVPPVLNKHKIELFFSPDGSLSLSTKVPSMNVIHDLNFEEYPEFFPISARKYYRGYFPRYARKAHRIATVSEFSKQDIVKRYGIDPEYIDVVYNGSNELYQPLHEKSKEKVRKKFSEGSPYFLFIGNIHPRKNLKNQLLAFDQFRQQTSSDIKFVVVGTIMWSGGEIKQVLKQMKHADDVIFAGRTEVSDLSQLIPASFALCYVSYYEGFGIPIVEAMYAETPVITASVTSMPEVGGDAALYADPSSVDSITQAMQRLYNEEGLRNKLVEEGKHQRTRFSWQQTADRLWKSIETCINSNL